MMKLTLRVKQAGKKRLLLKDKVIEMPDIVAPTLRGLIGAVVAQQVDEYNHKTPEENVLPFLSHEHIQELEENGKVGFGSIYHENQADLDTALQTAIQAFEDGLFAVFVDDVQAEDIDGKIELKPQSVITFIRLTFLSGSYW